MSIAALKKAVCEANLRLVADGLVLQTFGNVSGIDRARGVMAIKPSGVPYPRLRPADIVLVSLATGEPVGEGGRPSSDTPTHLVLYRAFPDIGGIAHTHSLYATAWAQARRSPPALGTTHADFFRGPIPCARPLTAREIGGDYEAATGHVILERFRRLDPGENPGVLVANHGPFAWGATPDAAAANAAALEYICQLASETLRVAPRAAPVSRALLEKHFRRKHGPHAYYGPRRPTRSP